MNTSPNLTLPYIAAAQAQKHVTHNEAIRALDALVQLTVVDRNVVTPPSAPTNGERYIVAPTATGLWAAQSNKIAAYQDEAWAYYTPSEGWLSWVSTEDIIVAWNGTAWVPAGGSSSATAVNPIPLIGINATADLANRLTVSSPATLFSHDGAGHQLKINKSAAEQTGSLLFQDNFSGRAELGLTGDDDIHIKVSADGSSWREALIIDRTTGTVELPLTSSTASTNLLINGDMFINQRAFAGGALAPNTYGHDRWKADEIGANYTVINASVTLGSGTLVQVIELAQFGLTTLQSTPLTASVENPSADLLITIGAVSALIPAGDGRQYATLTPSDSGDPTFKITKATAGSATFSRIKLEVGRRASAWQPRPLTTEQTLCKRYCIAGPATGYILGVADSPSTWLAQFFQFPVTMRAPPTITFSNPHNAAPTLSLFVVDLFRTGSTIIGTNSTVGFNAYTTISDGAMTAGAPFIAQGQWLASAEL